MSKLLRDLTGSNGTTVTEQLGLDSEVRELKFGSSFRGGRTHQQQGAFHTIKYDFKPASVDTSKMASLDMGQGGQVTVSVPHCRDDGTTVFKGSTRPYTKECVLIIDKDTGEIVLEKLSHNVQVKKTRQEGNGKKPVPSANAASNSTSTSGNSSGDVTKSVPSSGTGSSSGSRHRERDEASSKRSQNAVGAGSGTQAGRRPISPLPSTARHSPLPSSNLTHASHRRSPSPYDTKRSSSSTATSDTVVNKQQHSQSTRAPPAPSLTNIEDLISGIPPNDRADIKSTSTSSAQKESLDSSSDDSSSSSSSDNDDSSSGDEDMEKMPIPGIPSLDNSRNQSPSSVRTSSNVQQAMPSMPSHLLSEDLQLSDSDSD